MIIWLMRAMLLARKILTSVLIPLRFMRPKQALRSRQPRHPLLLSLRLSRSGTLFYNGRVGVVDVFSWFRVRCVLWPYRSFSPAAAHRGALVRQVGFPRPNKPPRRGSSLSRLVRSLRRP